ncbi:MAG: Tex-like N-terminal domain-containing protein, partial [Clostridia bacterium]|nr:Tex-like N-terminal domain-containing protein [Clostridia bacterium]
MTVNEQLSAELGLKLWQVEHAVELLDAGNTVPFIARYRKEATGELNDEKLRELEERLAYLRSMEERKADVKRIIEEQGNLTEELAAAIDACTKLTEIEDIYRPFRPKRKTRATVAKAKGLEPLAELLYAQNPDTADIDAAAAEYISEEKEVASAEEALAGAMDIIAENVSDNADHRKRIRELTFSTGVINTAATGEEDSVYRMYYDFSEACKRIAPHRVLAIDRGEKEGFL